MVGVRLIARMPHYESGPSKDGWPFIPLDDDRGLLKPPAEVAGEDPDS